MADIYYKDGNSWKVLASNPFAVGTYYESIENISPATIVGGNWLSVATEFSESFNFTEIYDGMELFENTEFIGKTPNDPVPDIVGYGHIHTPNIVRTHNKTIFNPGSVGMPIEMLNDNFFDKTNKFSTVASYIILEGNLNSKDFSSISFNLVRLPYDIEEEIKLLEKSTLPNKNKVITELRSATNYIHAK